MTATDVRLMGLHKLNERWPEQPSAPSQLRNAGPTALTWGTKAHEQEREALRRYQAAVAAALESLRHAERRFDESSAAIAEHIQQALAAEARRRIVRPLRAAGSSAERLSFSPRRAERTPDSIERSSFALASLGARAR